MSWQFWLMHNFWQGQMHLSEGDRTNWLGLKIWEECFGATSKPGEIAWKPEWAWVSLRESEWVIHRLGDLDLVECILRFLDCFKVVETHLVTWRRVNFSWERGSQHVKELTKRFLVSFRFKNVIEKTSFHGKPFQILRIESFLIHKTREIYEARLIAVLSEAVKPIRSEPINLSWPILKRKWLSVWMPLNGNFWWKKPVQYDLRFENRQWRRSIVPSVIQMAPKQDNRE